MQFDGYMAATRFFFDTDTRIPRQGTGKIEGCDALSRMYVSFIELSLRLWRNATMLVSNDFQSKSESTAAGGGNHFFSSPHHLVLKASAAWLGRMMNQ